MSGQVVRKYFPACPTATTRSADTTCLLVYRKRERDMVEVLTLCFRHKLQT